MAERPPIPATVELAIDAETLESAWEVFHRFEVLHHQMEFMNPIDRATFDRLAAGLGIVDGDGVIDLACGHGAALIRLAETTEIAGLGVDLAPWQIVRAAQRAAAADLRGHLSWRLGRAEDVPADGSWDHAICLGASWIWDGFAGTATALTETVRAGGTIMIGDLRRRDSTAPEDAEAMVGPLPSRGEQAQVLSGLGLVDVRETDPGPYAWERYQDELRAGAVNYLASRPGRAAEEYRREAEEWRAAHPDFAEKVAWTVWTARRPVRPR